MVVIVHYWGWANKNDPEVCVSFDVLDHAGSSWGHHSMVEIPKVGPIYPKKWVSVAARVQVRRALKAWGII